MKKRFAAAALLLVLAACDKAPAFYRVDPETLSLQIPGREGRPASPAPPRYARLEISALPAARSFLDQSIVTVRVVSGAVEVTRAFTGARSLTPEARERWFADVAVPLSEDGVVRVWVHASVVKGASPEKMGQIADATQALLLTLPGTAQVVSTTRSVVDLAAVLSDAKVDASYVQTFEVAFGAGCAEATATCLAAHDQDTFVATWGLSNPGEAATLKLDAGVLRARDGTPSSVPGLVLKVTTPSLPREIFKRPAQLALEAAAPRDGGTIQESDVDEKLVAPAQRPTLRAFRTRMNAARAAGTAEDAAAVAVASLDEWAGSACGALLAADTLPCTSARSVVARHRAASPTAERLAAVVQRWETASSQLDGLVEREGDRCVALGSARAIYGAAALDSDALLDAHPQLASTTPRLSALQRRADGDLSDLAEGCFALQLRAATRKDPEVAALLGSITPADVKKGFFYLPNRAALRAPVLDRVRDAIRSANAGVRAIVPPQSRAKLPTLDWFVTFAETQCADAASMSRMLDSRRDAIAKVIAAYLADALEAARPYRGHADVDALVQAALELENVPTDKAAWNDLAESLRGRRDALLDAVRKTEALTHAPAEPTVNAASTRAAAVPGNAASSGAAPGPAGGERGL